MIQNSPILLASNSTASSSSTSLASIPTHPSSPLQRKWSLRRQTQKLSGVNLISRTIAAAANGNAKGKDDESEEVDEGLWDNVSISSAHSNWQKDSIGNIVSDSESKEELVGMSRFHLAKPTPNFES